MVGQFGLEVVRAYMRHVQDNAEECVRRAIEALRDAEYIYPMDPDFDGRPREIRVRITRRPGGAVGGDRLHRHHGGARHQLQRAGAGDAGGGALRLPLPRRRRHPDERGGDEAARGDPAAPAPCSRPRYPAAVIAGNVETSQAVTSALFLALGVQAAAQSTMNNTTWGDDRLPVLRDDLRRHRRRACSRTGRGHPGTCGRALAHDQLAADRPGGAGMALPGGARRVPHPRGLRRRRAVPRRRRGGAAHPLPRADDGGDPRRPPGGAAARPRRRRRRAPAGAPGSCGRTAASRRSAAADRREVGPGDVFWLETPGGGGYGG